MRLEEIQKRLKAIEDASWDDEYAHILEDDLYREVLRHIAKGNASASPRELAKEALKSGEIKFTRYCS